MGEGGASWEKTPALWLVHQQIFVTQLQHDVRSGCRANGGHKGDTPTLLASHASSPPPSSSVALGHSRGVRRGVPKQVAPLQPLQMFTGRPVTAAAASFYKRAKENADLASVS